MKKWKLAAMMTGMTLLAACGADDVQNEVTDSTANADEPTEATAEGEVSGSLSFYTSQPDADAEALVAGFNEKYPDVDVSIFRSGTEEVISRVLAEDQAGDVQADVLLVADAVTFEGLKEEDLLMAYDSPEADAIPENFVDPDQMYYGTKVMSTVMAINTELVEEAPTSWSALTSEEAAGEVIMPSPLYSGAAAYNAGVFSRTDGFGWSFYEDLYANDTMVVQGNGGVLEAVAGGEKAYGMVVDFIVAKAKAEGSPIDLVYPEEGVPVITEPVGIMSGTDNEAAAKAFVDYVLSEEGQELSVEVGYTPIREGMTPPEGLPSAEELNVLSVELSELTETREADKEQFRAIFGDQ
ncbi:ABC transporter substrate-binding protein [Jeotgalibacillus sp. R-1-5s-1]|uniref:ABC transporter substrate-binding protein n=1 Tax=Jeotgalibacillus sp. R-1-5s-1 TaxID=2555897 RepID=UPI00106CA21E|nr:ABC transporter substrate-binding protein [Jeotgalibacillus sp. R-1-5s-1]TFD96618.1 extracellular solute-binding protein [Jeotgalibacillus sp. R-1-5s-1]